jgi:DNA-binding Lrp family transcriptional regulator
VTERRILMTAYVLIQTVAFGRAVAHKLRTIPGIVAADDINGPYDAIALARSASSAELAAEIVEAIRRLPEVTRAIVAPLNGHGFVGPELSGDHAA